MSLEILANEKCKISGFSCSVVIENNQKTIEEFCSKLHKAHLTAQISRPTDILRKGEEDTNTYIHITPRGRSIISQFMLAKFLHQEGYIQHEALLIMAGRLVRAYAETFKESGTEDFKETHKDFLVSMKKLANQEEYFKDYYCINKTLSKDSLLRDFSHSTYANRELSSGKPHLKEAINLLLQSYLPEQKLQWQLLLNEPKNEKKRKQLEESQTTNGIDPVLLNRIGKLHFGVIGKIADYLEPGFGNIHINSHVESYKRRRQQKENETLLEK